MSDSLLRVTDEQVAAAQLRIVLDEKLGRQTPPLVRRIAGMTGVARDEQEGLRSLPVHGAAEDPHRAPPTLETDCGEVLAAVWLFLDNEAEDEQRELVKHHLDECSSCLKEFGIEEHVRALVAHKGGGDHAPEALKERLRQSISEIVMRQTVLSSTEVIVEHDDDGNIVAVRSARTDMSTPRRYE